MKILKLQVWKYSWNFPILTKLINKYKELGFFKFILWLFLIWLGFKIIVVNGFIFVANLLGAGWEYAPLMRSLGIF